MELFETGQSTKKEYQKSQAVRVWDIIFIAPFLVYIAYNTKRLKNWERTGLYVIGITTLLYNGRNYLKNKNKSENKR
jgi:dipeptide/tripeptide permease|tara:strand:- start:2701 stop:2931 length:231 start_codon:yes stop_codon:yes gene_type:complete